MTKRKRTPKTIDDLRFDPQNARRYDEQNIDLIAGALSEVGAARSIVIDEGNQVLAGEGTLRGAKKAGLSKVQIIDADGETIIAVRRSNLTPEQKARLALYDNRTGELAEWDADTLKALQDAGIPIHDLWTEEELAAMLATDEAASVQPVKVERPTDVAWVLCAIPLERWPENQAHVEALQDASVFTTMVVRPRDAKEPKP